MEMTAKLSIQYMFGKAPGFCRQKELVAFLRRRRQESGISSLGFFSILPSFLGNEQGITKDLFAIDVERPC